MRKGIPAFTAFRIHLFAVLSVYANPLLRDLPADTWYQAPGTKMRAVCASETRFPNIHGSSGCVMVMEAWSGGAFDPGRKSLWVWGGGHGDYWGNELYSFDIETLKWERATDPSPVEAPKLSADPMPDGNPVARHTYDGLAWLTESGRLFGMGGSMAGNGYGTPLTWIFDPAASKWSNMKPSGDSNRPQTNCCNFTAEYDPVGGKVYMRDPNWLTAYDVAANSWSHVLEQSHDWGPGKAVIDTKRRILFTIGSKEFLAYDLDGKKDATAQWKTTGGDAILSAYGPGAAYDPQADRLVAWNGGGVYVLDPVSKAWTRKSGAGAPPAQLRNGTFGRFRYVAGDNVFILANSVDEDVWFYKHTAGGSAILPKVPGPDIPSAPRADRNAVGRAREDATPRFRHPRRSSGAVRAR